MQNSLEDLALEIEIQNRLHRDAEETIQESLQNRPHNTKKSYKAYQNEFIRWCAETEQDITVNGILKF